MPSPFPGMDPYLESPAFWSDFHFTFINYLREAIADRIPDNYEARIDERVSVEAPDPDAARQLIEPDVSILHDPAGRAGRPAPAGVAILEPITIPHVMLEAHRERFVKILQRPDRSLVTVIELLSPSNKVGDGAVTYQANRRALLLQDVNLVEIDLLLRGRRLPLSRPLPSGDYYTLISRCGRRPDCEVYAWTIRQPLPTLPIPLRAPDPDIPIDLGAVFATAYERARYARSLAYGAPPPAPVREEDRDWALGLARSMTKGQA